MSCQDCSGVYNGPTTRIFPGERPELDTFGFAKAQTGGTTLRHAPGFAYAVQKDAYVDLTFGNDVTWKANSSHVLHELHFLSTWTGFRLAICRMALP